MCVCDKEGEWRSLQYVEIRGDKDSHSYMQ